MNSLEFFAALTHEESWKYVLLQKSHLTSGSVNANELSLNWIASINKSSTESKLLMNMSKEMKEWRLVSDKVSYGSTSNMNWLC